MGISYIVHWKLFASRHNLTSFSPLSGTEFASFLQWNQAGLLSCKIKIQILQHRVFNIFPDSNFYLKQQSLESQKILSSVRSFEVKLREKRVKFVLQHDRLQASHTHDNRTVRKSKVTRKSFVNLLVPTTCCSLRHSSFCCRKFWLKPTTVIFLVMCLWGANHVFRPQNPLQWKVLTQGLKIVGWSLSEHICSTRYLNPKLGYPTTDLKWLPSSRDIAKWAIHHRDLT